jgi:hypothetical protein
MHINDYWYPAMEYRTVPMLKNGEIADGQLNRQLTGILFSLNEIF